MISHSPGTAIITRWTDMGDSMILAFPVGPAASGRELCDIVFSEFLNHVFKNCGNPRTFSIRWLPDPHEKPKLWHLSQAYM